MIGGIGLDASCPLGDVHVLNAATLQWSTLRDESEYVPQTLAGVVGKVLN